MGYEIVRLDDDLFELKQNGFLLQKFKRSSFREDLEKYSDNNRKSSKWIGSILRILDKKFPYVYIPKKDNSYMNDIHNEHKYINYLRSKGFLVYKKAQKKDREMIDFLENRGYIIAGVMENEVYHQTEVLTNVES